MNKIQKGIALLGETKALIVWALMIPFFCTTSVYGQIQNLYMGGRSQSRCLKRI